jgi:hypothetical protein
MHPQSRFREVSPLPLAMARQSIVGRGKQLLLMDAPIKQRGTELDTARLSRIRDVIHIRRRAG